MLTLRAYQQAAISAALDAIRNRVPAGLWSMPTGTGKTVTFSALASRLGWKTLILVHREELIEQTIGAFAIAWPGAAVGVIKGDRDEWEATGFNGPPAVVVASVASLHPKRLQRIPRDRFALIVCDEAHHSIAPSWLAILNYFRPKFLLGCTATAFRSDGQGLADLYGEKPLYSFPLRSAIEQGHLARIRQYSVETPADLDSVDRRAGDLATGALSAAVNTEARNRVVREAFQRHAADRKAVAFCVDVQHSTDLAAEFQQAGITSATVTGETPTEERRNLLADFAAGRIRVLTNCAVLTEGFDDPTIDCVLMTRPTTSRGLYVQCIGRALRLAPGKVDALILDFRDNAKKHKIIDVVSLLGAPKATDANGADVLDVVDADVAEAEARHEIESNSPLAWRLTSVCPWPTMPTLSGYVSAASWHNQPASDGQLRYLAAFGCDTSRGLSKGEASFLIDRLRELEAAHPIPPTPKQTSFLKRAGAWREGLSKREATTLIGALMAEREYAA